MIKNRQEIRRKLQILNNAKQYGDVSKSCRYFGIGRASYYHWKYAYQEQGEAGFSENRSVPHNHPYQTPDAVAQRVLYLRKN